MMRTKGWKTVWQRIVFIMHSGQMPPGIKKTTTLAITEREQGQAYRLLRDEGRGTVERDESNGAAGHHILALMAMHPRTVGLGLTRRKDGHPSGEQERTEGGRNQGDDNVLLCHGIHSLQTYSVLANFTKVY